jgi:uncharacterized membrane protein
MGNYLTRNTHDAITLFLLCGVMQDSIRTIFPEIEPIFTTEPDNSDFVYGVLTFVKFVRKNYPIP